MTSHKHVPGKQLGRSEKLPRTVPVVVGGSTHRSTLHVKTGIESTTNASPPIPDWWYCVAAKGARQTRQGRPVKLTSPWRRAPWAHSRLGRREAPLQTLRALQLHQPPHSEWTGQPASLPTSGTRPISPSFRIFPPTIDPTYTIFSNKFLEPPDSINRTAVDLVLLPST